MIVAFRAVVFHLRVKLACKRKVSRCYNRLMKIWDLLLYITNNESQSRHEEHFDIAFFIVNTIAIVAGASYCIYIHELQWIPFLVIEYTWAIDTMRHNRP
ncbi:MAG: hypothetical protein RIQ56_868 [Candidatus Parcubacteria bacterium]|jgi:hypothetical protein